jgi:hypothetical protein
MEPESIARMKAKLAHVNAEQPAKTAHTGTLLCPDEATYHNLMSETYFERYYPSIQKWSFPTAFRNLKPATLQALIHAHEDWEKRHVKRGWVEAFPVLNELAAEIEEAKKELGAKDIFVRLSSRSPKDAALSHQRIDSLFKAELRDLEDFDRLAQTDEPETLIAMIDNRKLHALYRATTVALRTNTGVDAVTLLVESKRIQEDLRRAVQKPDEDMPFKVVIREFRQFPVELELRAFVKDGKLTALTQYNEMVFFPALLYKHNLIQETIIDFWKEHVSPVVKLKDYALDLVLIPRSSTPEDPYMELKPFIIEINPLAEFTGSGLFKWEIAHDNEVLRGVRPFEFRILTHALQNPMKDLPAEWRTVIATAEILSPRRGTK